jgi:tetratricopeptide (TPR) repeat protein
MVFFGYSAFSAGRTDSLLTVLKNEILRKKAFDALKEAQIKRLKLSLSKIPAGNREKQYEIYDKLYEEYKTYQFDSAYVYTRKIENITLAMNDKPKFYETKIKLAFILLSAGMFKEGFDCLNQIDVRMIGDSSKIDYYSFKSRAYSDLADYNNDKNFTPQDNLLAVKYIDSALQLCQPGSYRQYSLLGNKQIFTGNTLRPSTYLTQLLLFYPLTAHQRAMAATGLSFFYNRPADLDERVYLLEVGAINDIRSSTKETVAAFKLGEVLYKQGKVNDAYILLQQALDDAQYYGARLRKIKIAAVLPIVAATKNINTENEKNSLRVYLLSIVAIALLITLISFIVFVQLKRLKAKEVIIEEKNIQLEKINDRLSEDSHIKEEYIGYFFNIISSYILKLEKLKRNVERKIITKKYEDILITINEINIKKERETLFYTFDHVFLKIFPNFITEFNALLKKEDQIWPKDHEVLNTDLRIFALTRLGISDNQTIANILEYSVSTIYVYKMRLKAKAIVPGDQFDSKIMAIEAAAITNKP